MSNQNPKIKKIVDTLSEGSESVRNNPSEQNYQEWEGKLDKAGNSPNWAAIIIIGVVVLALLFSFTIFSGAAVVAISNTSTTSTSYHPSDALGFNNHYYRVYTTSSISWNNAKSQCENQEGYLAVITSSSENDFVWNLAIQNSFPDYTVVWLGATDSSQEGNWQWISGSSFNSLGNLITDGSTYENYLNLRVATGMWEDFPLEGEQVGEQWYVCEWDR